MQTQDGKTFFGFKRISITEKAKMVGDVFSSVAGKYDIMNDAMSLGIHRLWKKQFINLIPKDIDYLIDVAGGTGDISIGFLKSCDRDKWPTTVVCDINQNMLSIAKDKAIDRNIIKNINYVQGDAESLPLMDNIFDCYTIAFGIRNVTDIQMALSESYRILKPGGKFLCLEFSKVDSVLLEKFYDFYSMNIIPKIGQYIAGNKDAYQYLVESIRQFPDQEEFKGMISNAGYKDVYYTNLTFGVAAIHMATKL